MRVYVDQRQVAPHHRVAHQAVQLAEIHHGLHIDQPLVPLAARVFVIDPQDRQLPIQLLFDRTLQLPQEPLHQRVAGGVQDRIHALLAEHETQFRAAGHIAPHQAAADVRPVIQFAHHPQNPFARLRGNRKHLRAVDQV